MKIPPVAEFAPPLVTSDLKIPFRCAKSWQLTPQSRIFLAVPPVDFRKGIEGLAALCRQTRHETPVGGTVYVFRNRTGTTLTLLAYDGQGFWLCTKRLSHGHFSWWPTASTQSVTLSAWELTVLLGNGDPDRAQLAPDWRPVRDAGTRAA
jgi:transposase